MRTSEWVSPGHPDKIADNISEYILDRYLEKDSNVRYALEVMIKNNNVYLGGEVTSTHQFSVADIEHFVKDAIRNIGYNADYYSKWGDYAININEVKTINDSHIQSPDISQGVNNNGWGDQGIFWGYAEHNRHTNYMPLDHYLAKDLGMVLYNNAKENGVGGLDIKTQITLDDTDMIEQVIVAIPVLNDEEYSEVTKVVHSWLMNENVDLMEFIEQGKLIINGTGIYQYHSSIGDCGVTGRKLVVDFYGGNSKIGGGSPWTKDGTKADLTLNLYVRNLAKQYIQNECKDCFYVQTSACCCIGKSEVYGTIKGYDFCHNLVYTKEYKDNFSPKVLIDSFRLNEPNFNKLCMEGLFTNI